MRLVFLLSQEMAQFLLHTWKLITQPKRGDLSKCQQLPALPLSSRARFTD